MANSHKKLAVERLLSTHATVVETSSSCVRIEEVHMVHGRLNLLDVDRLVDIGFSNPQFSSRKLSRGGITWPLRPNTRPATIVESEANQGYPRNAREHHQ